MAGYFGEFITHAGATVGAEEYLLDQQRFNIFLRGELGGYVDTRNHTALFLDLRTGYRYTSHYGWFFDQSIGLGYMHAFLNGGKVFEVGADRDVQEIKDGGSPHVMPLVSFGTGLDLQKRHPTPALISLRPQVFREYPFNHYALVHVALEADVTVLLR